MRFIYTRSFAVMATPIALFGVNLFAQLVKLGGLASSAGGYFISPLSAYIALVLLLNGSTELSQTQRELWVQLSNTALPSSMKALTPAENSLNTQTATLMRSLQSQSSGKGTELLIANAVWTNRTTLTKAYQDSMMKLFQAPVTPVTSVAPINAWANKSTKGLIKQALPADAEFKAVITNAVYFKAAWMYQFDQRSTYAAPFATSANRTVQAQMMNKGFSQDDVEFSEVEASFRAVKLPYKGSNIKAIAVLPDQKKYGLNADNALVQIGIDRILNARWTSASEAVPDLRVALPKFKIKLEMLPVGQALKAMGVSTAFDEKRASFNRLSNEPLYVTDVVQSVAVIVDEVGTEAAAVTSIMVGATSAPLNPTPPLVFDRPFIFLIVDEKSNEVLFMGTVKDPSKMAA